MYRAKFNNRRRATALTPFGVAFFLHSMWVGTGIWGRPSVARPTERGEGGRERPDRRRGRSQGRGASGRGRQMRKPRRRRRRCRAPQQDPRTFRTAQRGNGTDIPFPPFPPFPPWESPRRSRAETVTDCPLFSSVRVSGHHNFQLSIFNCQFDNVSSG